MIISNSWLLFRKKLIKLTITLLFLSNVWAPRNVGPRAFAHFAPSKSGTADNVYDNL